MELNKQIVIERMKLHIINYTNGQIIEHSSVVILKGYLVNEEDQEKNTSQLKPKENYLNLPNLLEIFKYTEPTELIPYNYLKENFLCLLHLTQGDNSFTFKNKFTKKIIFSLK